MPFPSGRLTPSQLVDILRALVSTKQTGYLKMKEGEREGFIAVENGVLVNAQSGTHVALPALFQFVSWHEASFHFHERPIPADLPRDLCVYEPEVLISGVEYKVNEMEALEQSIPSYDCVLHYIGGETHGSVEATAADLGLLSLADGHRSVRDIAAVARLSPLEVARSLARFRLPGVLELVPPKPTRTKPALAA